MSAVSVPILGRYLEELIADALSKGASLANRERGGGELAGALFKPAVSAARGMAADGRQDPMISDGHRWPPMASDWMQTAVECVAVTNECSPSSLASSGSKARRSPYLSASP